jgi:hypothetical protein
MLINDSENECLPNIDAPQIMCWFVFEQVHANTYPSYIIKFVCIKGTEAFYMHKQDTDTQKLVFFLLQLTWKILLAIGRNHLYIKQIHFDIDETILHL